MFYKKLLTRLEKNKEIKQSLQNKNSSFILISYYWGKNVVNKGSIYKLTYGQQVDRLIQDCKNTQTNYFFVRYPELEEGKISYQDALGLKPYFIKICLERFPNHKCIFIDTDLRLLKYPVLFDVDADCWFINWSNLDFDCYNPYQLELSGAVLGFSNTHNSHTLLDILLKEYDPQYSEDKSFSGIITRNFLNIGCRCVWLPETYLYMFQNHTYVPHQGYTEIVNYSQELRDTNFRNSDLVLVHEDFETGALDDVYDNRVGKDRYPPKLDAQFGEKLRCINVKFEIFNNWYLSSSQFKHYRTLIENKLDEKIISVKSIPHIKLEKFNIISGNGNTPYIFVFIHTSSNKTDKFIDFCEKKNISYKIVNGSKNIPKILYTLMKKSTLPHVFINRIPKKIPKELNTNNIDFMTYNINNDSNCYDPRILKVMNNDLIYFANNHIVLNFLKIWAYHNTSNFISLNCQEKSLEYAFNITYAINIMRCFWFDGSTAHKRKYLKVPKKVNKLTHLLEQCGVKPSRKSNLEPRYQHKYGSRGIKQKKIKFLKMFV